MQVVNKLMPNQSTQMVEMMKPGPDGPIYMVNMLKFKEKAEYDDGCETSLSGRQAYMIYGKSVAELLPKFNGEIVFAGDVSFLMLGEVEDLWDEIVIVKYPNRQSLVQMAMSPEWQEISVHRAAGLEGQLNIETVDPIRA